MNILRLSKKAYELYRTTVRDNEEITYDQARRRLTRNVILAKDITPVEERSKLIKTKVYAFGNLHIIVRLNKVIDIENHKKCGNLHRDWKLDVNKRTELNEILGIVDQANPYTIYRY